MGIAAGVLAITLAVGAAPEEGCGPAIIRSRAVQIGTQPFAARGPGGGAMLELALFDNVHVTIELDPQIDRRAGGFTRRGRIVGDPLSWVTVSVQGDAVVADIQSPALGSFRLRSPGGGARVVEQADSAAAWECGLESVETAYRPLRTSAVPVAGGACAEDGSVIDLLVVYTPAAAAAEGGEAAMIALVNLLVDQANQALADSLIGTAINLVGAQEVAYVESGNSSTDLAQLVDVGDGVLDEVHDLRDSLKADLVTMITNAGSVCGVARIAVGPGPTPLPDQAFNVVVRSCASAPIYAFTHELGHNLGCRHDWDSEACNDGAQRFAKAYVEPGGAFKTVVSAGGDPAPAILQFSNPDVDFGGQPTGIAADQADPADNALSIALAALTVANYRSTDCNGNGICDDIDIAGGTPDCNANGIPDECEADCNANGVPDDCDISGGAADADGNGIPDECEPAVLSVDASATGLGTGASWTDAFTDLQQAFALAAASGGPVQEIWVAAGTYTPGPAPHQAAWFQLINGVAVYGGFAGDETSLDQRDPVANPTILSGDLNGDDGAPGSFANNQDNSVAIVNAGNQTDPTAILDGFTITGGNSWPDTSDCFFSPYSAGAGIRINKGAATIRNCDILYNTSNGDGGGLYVVNVANPTFINCRFIGNRATGPLSSSSGGGAYLNPGLGNVVTMINCSFIGNDSSGGGGGVQAICQSGLYYNCAFLGNHAAYTGGGISTAGGGCSNEPVFVNCTVYGNTSDGAGAGIYSFTNSIPIISNCILWANAANGQMTENAQYSPGFQQSPIINNSCVMGWSGVHGGVGNIGDDPLLADADGADDIPGTADDDVRLTALSPCLDAGDNALLPADIGDLDGDADTAEPHPLDLDGLDRTIDGNGDAAATVDMGSYEFVSCPWDCDGSDDGNVNVLDVLAFLGQYDMSAPVNCTGGSCDYDGNGCVDVVDLLKLLSHYTTDPSGVGCPQ